MSGGHKCDACTKTCPGCEVPADEDIDTSEVPPLDASFFEGARLTRPGEPLIPPAQDKPAGERG